MPRGFYTFTVHWRDFSGRTASSKLYGAGDLDVLTDGSGSFLSFLILPENATYAGGHEGLLQACSNARIEQVDGPVPEDFGQGLPFYGQASQPFGTCQDRLVLLSNQTDEQGLSGFHPQPLVRIALEIPAPRWQPTVYPTRTVPGCFALPFPPHQDQAVAFLGIDVAGLFFGAWQANSLTGHGRWSDTVNAARTGWVSPLGVCWPGGTATAPRRVHRLSRLVQDQVLTPSLSGPAL